jgi:hypothetical protein
VLQTVECWEEKLRQDNATRRITLIVAYKKNHTQLMNVHHQCLLILRHLTLNSFEKGGDGSGPSECDNQYHSDNTLVVAHSTGWFDQKSRCLDNIKIGANGRSVMAKVVDECDSTKGCDEDHDYEPPCPNNIVDASKAVWEALGVPKNQWGGLDITWSDA